MTLSPIFVFVLSAILLNEKITLAKVFGLSLALIGALLIIYQPGAMDLTLGNWKGDIMVLLNALSYGAYLVLVKPLMGKYSALTVTKWIFSIGFILVIPIGINEAISVQWEEFQPKAWWSGVYVIIGVTVIAYFVNVWSMRRVNPTLVGIYIYLQPLFASFIATLFFDENLTWLHIVSAVFIFTGIYLVNMKKYKTFSKSNATRSTTD